MACLSLSLSLLDFNKRKAHARGVGEHDIGATIPMKLVTRLGCLSPSILPWHSEGEFAIVVEKGISESTQYSLN